jgi:hypothetical protein
MERAWLRSYHFPNIALPVRLPFPEFIFAFIGTLMGLLILGNVLRIRVVFAACILDTFIAEMWRLKRCKCLIPEWNSQFYDFFNNVVERFVCDGMKIVDV